MWLLLFFFFLKTLDFPFMVFLDDDTHGSVGENVTRTTQMCGSQKKKETPSFVFVQHLNNNADHVFLRTSPFPWAMFYHLSFWQSWLN